MPTFKRIGGGPWKYGQKSDDLTWNDPPAFPRAVAVFCPGFQKGWVPAEKGIFSAVSGPSKGDNYLGELKKKGIISAVKRKKKGTISINQKSP